MKIIITGSLGNISRPLSTDLLSKGHQVTVVSSSEEKRNEIISLGASAAIGSVSDENFLAGVFRGADLVYLMVPNNFAATDYRAYIKSIGQHYANAVKAAGVKKIVLLSSIGAHLEKGTGPISGLHDVEQIFNKLENTDILFLRPGFFYTNFYANIDLIKHAGIIGSNYGAEQPIIMVDPEDIAAIAANAIDKGFSGKSILYIASDKRTLKEVAAALGKAIDKPELPWVEFDDQQAFDGMTGAGLPEEITRNYVEMGTAVRSGILWEDFELNKNVPEGKTKLEDFALKFSRAYQA